MERIIESGEYQVSGDAFIIGKRKVLIRHRKETSEKKPELFLSAVSPYSYVSSLYPSADGFTMDEAGQRYRVRVKEDSIFFSQI